MSRRSLLACAALSLTLWACGADSAPAQSSEPPVLAPQDLSSEELKAAAGDGPVAKFYAAREWRPAWTEPQAEALWVVIAGAERHGLNPERFMKLVPTDGTPAEREAGLSRAALAYAEALARGAVDPQSLGDIFTLDRNNADVAGGLAQALDAGDLQAWYDSLPPRDAEYAALSEAYREAVRLAREQPRPPVPLEGALIRPGGADPRLPAIAAALHAEGFLPEPGAATDVYGPELQAGVRSLQEAYGLKVDGVVGPNTLRAVNLGPAERARRLAVNLERRRWLARDLPATRIDVNTASAHLTYWRDGAVAHRDVVVVGDAQNPTPQLQSPIYRLVANPPWTVPKRIAEQEILPKGPGYLAANNMVIKNGWVVQQPGPESALGEVKFDMINDYAIYLHDTPAKALFNEAERHRSHGCVRVHDALGFARLLAEHDGKLAAFEEALATGAETPVPLSKRIPVRLLYHTAFVQDGRLQLRPDVYGRDAKLAEAMGFEVAGGPLALGAEATDVGP